MTYPPEENMEQKNAARVLKALYEDNLEVVELEDTASQLLPAASITAMHASAMDDEPCSSTSLKTIATTPKDCLP